MMLRKLLSDSAIYGGADFVAKGVALFTFPIIAAVFSPTDFGTLELVLTLVALLGSIANLGLNNAAQRFYWDKDVDRNEQARLISSGLVVLVLSLSIISVLCALAIVVNQFGFRLELGAISVLGLAAAVFFMNFTQIIQYLLDVLRLHFSPWRFMIVSSASRIGSAVTGMIAVVLFGVGLDGFISVQVVVLALAIPVALFLTKKDITRDVNVDTMKQLIGFGYPFVFVGIAFWLFASMDRWMLAAMSSVEEVGIYSVANRFAMIVMFFSAAFGQAWSPVSIKVRTDNPTIYRQFYADILLVLFAVMLVIASVVALFAKDVLVFLMPSTYWAAAAPMAILSLGLVFQSTQQVTAIGISLEKKTHLFARLAWFAAGANLVLNAMLIPQFGATGAAWATAASYGVLTVGYCYYTQLLHTLPIAWAKLAYFTLIWTLVAIGSIWSQTAPVSVSVFVMKALAVLILTVACSITIPWKSLLDAK